MHHITRNLIIFLSLIVVFSAPVSAQQRQQRPQRPVVAAPDVVPPATEEMQNPEYWVKRIGPDAEKVVMTPAQIQEFNKKNKARPLDTQDIDGNPYSIRRVVADKDIIGVQFYLEDPLTITTFPGDSLRVRLGMLRRYIEGSGSRWYDRRHLPLPAIRKQEMLDQFDEAAIPNTVQVRHGILVHHTMTRSAPTEQPAYGGQNGFNDALASASFETCMPVAILHQTKDGDWLYIKADGAFGWIPAIDVAEADIPAIRRLAEPKDFVVAIAHKVPVYADKACKMFLSDLYQGSKVPLVGKTTGGYQVHIPFRKADGKLETAVGWLRSDADITVGYQPYTQANVIRTMFRLLNRPYGWADSENDRDCCGSVRSVLKTFGIITPRWTTHELHYTDHVYAFPRNTPKEKKYEIVSKCEPGITMIGHGGHIIMYLGAVDGNHFVIHSNGYSYSDDTTEYRIARVGITDTEIEGGNKVDSWTEISVFKP
jgi:hypothetical protein